MTTKPRKNPDGDPPVFELCGLTAIIVWEAYAAQHGIFYRMPPNTLTVTLVMLDVIIVILSLFAVAQARRPTPPQDGSKS